MSRYDPIPELVKLGYTSREAAFLYLVGMHSGYFLRRQFNQFVARDDGATSQRLCDKVTERGHAEVMDFGQKRFVFHLQSKTIYRLLGIEDSQNRRRKGDREIKARLMQLDYLLDYFGAQFLETEQAKVSFFHDQLGVPLEVLPQARFESRTGGEFSTRYFVDRFPIMVQEGNRTTSSPQVSFAFIDDGARTVTAFENYLHRLLPLSEFLRNVEVIYVADSERNFAAAEEKFERVVHNGKENAQRGSLLTGQFPARMPRSPAVVRLRGHLLTYSYPIWSPRYKGIGL